jgi:hypothetical protein
VLIAAIVLAFTGRYRAVALLVFAVRRPAAASP